MGFKKKQKFILDCQAIVGSYSFSDDVEQALYDYIEVLADRCEEEGDRYLPLPAWVIQIKALQLLPYNQQLKAVTETAAVGWKSLLYKINDIKNEQLKSSGVATSIVTDDKSSILQEEYFE